MEKKDCYYLGKVIKTHGVKGDVMVFLDADNPERYLKIKSLFIEKEENLILHAVTNVKLKDNIARMHLEGIEDMNAAEEILKYDVYMPLSFLPELDDKNFYFHEVINYKVIDKIKGEIGVFEKVFDSPQQTIAQIRNKDKEILVPMISEFIERIDRKEKILYLNLPDGLVDLYLGNQE